MSLIDTLYQLPTEQLVAEGNALSARMLGSQYATRDFAIVVAMTQRLQNAAIGHARAKVRLGAPEHIELEPRGREALEGMLVLDLPEVA